MKITWIIGGLTVPHIGATNEGKIADVPEPDAHSLVKQGIAKYTNKPKPETKKPMKGVI